MQKNYNSAENSKNIFAVFLFFSFLYNFKKFTGYYLKIKKSRLLDNGVIALSHSFVQKSNISSLKVRKELPK